jgi:hypothetical protein
MGKTITKEEHRNGLVIMYADEVNFSMPGSFKQVLFKEALRKLGAGVDPKKVEDWVVNIEKAWRTFP